MSICVHKGRDGMETKRIFRAQDELFAIWESFRAPMPEAHNDFSGYRSAYRETTFHYILYTIPMNVNILYVTLIATLSGSLSFASTPIGPLSVLSLTIPFHPPQTNRSTSPTPPRPTPALQSPTLQSAFPPDFLSESLPSGQASVPVHRACRAQSTALLY